jgi:hypothetical protein
LITEVNHTISPGVFQTSFVGTRQRIFAAPRINNYLISLNQNLLQKLEDKLKITQTAPTTAATNETSKKSNAAPNSCVTSLVKKYEKYVAANSQETKTTTLDLFSNIYKNRTVSLSDRQQKILTFSAFAFAYVMSYENSMIQGYNNNYGNVDLGQDWGGAGTNNFLNTYCCVNIGTDRGSNPKPFANFASIDNFSKLIISRLQQNFDQIKEFYPGTILPTADALYNYFKAAWPKNRTLPKELQDFEKNQGKEVRAKFDKAVLEIRVLAPQLNIDLAVSTPSPSSSQNVPNVTPTPTPSPAAVNQVQTPNADDRTILTNASKTGSIAYTLNASTSSNGLLKIEGNIGSLPLSKSYKLKVYLISFEGTQSETVIGETELTPKSLGQNNGYTFTTSKSFRRECDIAADQRDNSIGFKVQVIEYPEYQYANTFRVMKYDCPTRNLLPGDVVTIAVYDQINANPCAICYPNGGPNVKLGDKECLPNTFQPRENIFNTTTDKDATGKITKVTFTVKPDVGNWKIATGKYTKKCKGSIGGSTAGEISINKQSISFDIEDIIAGCDPGEYTVTLEATAQAYLQDGNPDNTKRQQYTTYVVQGII